MKPKKQKDQPNKTPKEWNISRVKSDINFSNRQPSIKKDNRYSQINKAKDEDIFEKPTRKKINSISSLKTTNSSQTKQSLIASEKNQKQTTKHTYNFLQQKPLQNPQHQNHQPQQTMRPSSQQSRWNRQSQIGTRSRLIRQYERYFSDADNVFYEETQLMKQLEMIKWCWKKILFLFLFSSLFWLMIWSVSPYPYKCPRHATCGAYIHCHQGYVLNEKLQICQIDPKVTEYGLAIMNSVIEEMKLQYGQKQCTIPFNATINQLEQHLAPPNMTLRQIFKKLDILNDDDFYLLRNVLGQHFGDKGNQKIAKFDQDFWQRYYPLQRKYSITCKMNLFYRDNFSLFLVIITILIISLVLSLFKISKSLQKKKGKKIYEFLRAETIRNKEINYEHYRVEIQDRFNNNRVVSEQLWLLINDFRIQQKAIGCYEINQGPNQGIIWRHLGSF